MSDKTRINEKAHQLISLTIEFCEQHLGDEYEQLCEKLIRKMSRKRNVPYLAGRIEIWAAAVIYALGQINFLFDRSFEPYATHDDICDHFGTKKSTTSQKAKFIRDMFKMRYGNDEFLTERNKKDEPFSKSMMINGLIVPIDLLGSKSQKEDEEDNTMQDKRQTTMDNFI
ncbi:hypothetical protein C5S53_03410 [Methanophagales archaeon]|nr:hypothetical protein C5S53_03410 [Methanophagales archaeon]